MAVLYGRATESIGAVTIIDSATYADVRALIRPLIESYYNRLKEVDGWQGKHVDDGFADKSDAFFIPDPEGNIVPRELEFVSNIHANMYAPCISPNYFNLIYHLFVLRIRT